MQVVFFSCACMRVCVCVLILASTPYPNYCSEEVLRCIDAILWHCFVLRGFGLASEHDSHCQHFLSFFLVVVEVGLRLVPGLTIAQEDIEICKSGVNIVVISQENKIYIATSIKHCCFCTE